MSDKFNDILNEVKKVKKTVQAFLPSQNKVVDLMPLSLAQQKSIIESTINNTVSLINFNTNLYKILNQNIQSISGINTIDRVNLVLTLRHYMQDLIVVEDRQHSIKSIIDNNKLLRCPQQVINITSNNFVFSLKVPTLDIDNKVNQYILKKYKEDDDKLKGFISDLYVGEILKFITSIKIVSSDREIDISSMSVSECFELLESVDSAEYTNIIKFITSIREFEKELTKVPNTDTFIDIVPDLFVI